MSDILVEVEASGIALVTLNRTERRNAVTLGMWCEFSDIFRRLADDVRVKAIVLVGRGEHFSGGADITEFTTRRRGAANVAAYAKTVDACAEILTNLAKPTIAAISGYCLGGGCTLAMACDFRLADRSARFGIPAARLGIVYGVPDSRNLLGLVGLSRAKRILFSARQFGAVEAERIGFIDEIVDTDVEGAAKRFAASLTESAPLSIAGAKLILHTLVNGFAERERPAIEAIVQRSAASRDYEEGVRAFLEKRQPVFDGS